MIYEFKSNITTDQHKWEYPNCTERELHTWNATHDANSTETNSMTNVCSLYCFLLISIIVYFTMQRYCDFS